MVIPFILSALISAGLVYLQYFYRSGLLPNKGLLAFLRFIGIFVICILILGPKIERDEFVITKQPLIFLYDNSSSISKNGLQDAVLSVQDYFLDHAALKERFGIFNYAFGKSLDLKDSLNFNEEITDIHAALKSINKTYRKERPIVILVSDGNQTGGRNYANHEYEVSGIFPVVIGDTTRAQDIALNQINVNRFAFSENEYPIEILYSIYSDEPINTDIIIRDNGKIAVKKELRLEKGSKSGSFSAYLLAKQPGLHEISAQILPAPNEKNTKNNSLEAAIEVVDERIKIGIVSNYSHPDIGALKRSIESNQQREFKLFSPKQAIQSDWDPDILVLMDPDSAFEKFFLSSSLNQIPYLVLAGNRTDWDFLNRIQEEYQFEESGFSEDFLPIWNADFTYYQYSLDFIGFPPLEGPMGDIILNTEHQSILFKNVDGFTTSQPLITLLKGEVRKALILGKGLWKWRLETFLQTGNFEMFDDFMANIWLYLSESGKSNRLQVEYKPLYESPSSAALRTRYFDESLNFDPNMEIVLELVDSAGTKLSPITLVPTTGFYEADLQHLESGLFQFKISVSGTSFSQSGNFKIQPFRLESLSLGADGKHLNELARNNNGELYFPSQLDELKDNLLKSDEFRPVQRNNGKIVSLINIQWLLVILVLAFSIEWMIRKYNGLI